ncbi:uncharacterized protein V1516DRAFT_44651 [Lipomyces oligophaga]|uniref:uncharacterized protein n=1 Tax=Lipomyces oligophaga TaxID=45792 RepID=UPI0034D0110F
MTVTQTQLCRRCMTTKVDPIPQAVVVSRKEPFCKTCFVRFLRGKQRRQLADYKVSYEPRKSIPLPAAKIMLALSLGHSSLALLEMLTAQIIEQKEMHRGHSGIDLVAVYVDEWESQTTVEVAPAEEILNRLRIRYTNICRFERVPVSKFLSPGEFQLFHHDDIDIADYSATDLDQSATEFTTISNLLSGVRDRSARSDILATIRKRLIRQAAKENGCSAILWGDTVTRLAELSLSLTSKGRGTEIPTLLSETREQAIDGISNIYPLREVLRPECVNYVSLLDVSDYVLARTEPSPVVLRMMTIDDLIARYIEDVEVDFPGISSTVVRTASKLSSPFSSTNTFDRCMICGSLCLNSEYPETWLQKITVNQPFDNTLDSTIAAIEPKKTKLCYGCLVATKGSTFAWPRRSTTKEVLDQFEI